MSQKSRLKVAGALDRESMVNTVLLAPRLATESRMHASRPTRLPVDEMRMLALAIIYFVRGSSASDPTNSGIVAWPAWLMPSRRSTCNTVIHRILASNHRLR